MSIYKIQQFHFNTVDFWSKNLDFYDPSSKKLHDITDISEYPSKIGGMPVELSVCLNFKLG